MMEKNSLPPFLIEHTPWETGPNPIWPATAFTLRRNLARYHFPPKMAPDQFQQVFSLFSEKLPRILKAASCFKAEDLSALDKEFLYEHFLCIDGFQNTLAGQGFVIDDTGVFLALLNVEDHLQLKLIDTQGTLEASWNKLNQIETALGEAVEYAYSLKFGYLTSDPHLCGTSLQVQAYLHVPALIHTGQLHETILKQKEESVTITGMGGTLDETVGDVLILSNTCTLGLDEETILRTIQSMVMKLMALEKTLRIRLKSEKNLDMKDQISRAYGLLVHSYQLQTKEALGALSLLKLGLDLDWIEGVSHSTLNTLFFQCRRAHLGEILGNPLSDPHETARIRAEFIHKPMQSIHIKNP